jgi:RNA polymerase sigma factor (sigma-70 family)
MPILQESNKRRTTRTGKTLRRARGPADGRRRTSLAARRHLLERTARRLAATEVAYIAHPAFVRRNAAEWIAAHRPSTLDDRSAPECRVSGPGVAFLSCLVQERLLAPQEEVYLFLRMNYLKHRAEVLRRRLKPEQPDAELIATIQQALKEAAKCRDRLVTANLRLVVAVATKLSYSIDALGELVSEGLIPLIRAVELFDVSRGHRFSTYATWAVRNQMVRVLQRQRQSRERLFVAEQPSWDRIADVRPATANDERTNQERQSYVAGLMAQLSDRERQIVSARFGLNGHPSGRSLAEIADELDLSKERVRQIALQALEKLRLAADPRDAESLISSDHGL